MGIIGIFLFPLIFYTRLDLFFGFFGFYVLSKKFVKRWIYSSYRDNLISNFSRAYLIGVFKRSTWQIDNTTIL